MATYRGSGSGTYDIGEKPPFVNWTFVKGDTASFRVYVTDDARQPLNIPDWNISMQIKRPNIALQEGQVTDDAGLLYTLTPAPANDDESGEFTVSLTATQTMNLITNDIFAKIEIAVEYRIIHSTPYSL